MEKVKIQKLTDRIAITVSTICILHCLLTPLLIIVVPITSATFLADEIFHKVLVAFILPFSVIALFIGCRRHRDRFVLSLGGLGLTALVIVAIIGHETLGELGEKVATSISGAILITGHIRNFYLCRNVSCEI